MTTQSYFPVINRPLSRFLLLLQFHAKAIVRLTSSSNKNLLSGLLNVFWKAPFRLSTFFSDDRHETDFPVISNIALISSLMQWDHYALHPAKRTNSSFQQTLKRAVKFRHNTSPPPTNISELILSIPTPFPHFILFTASTTSM